jgi:hypothetical protein
MLEAGGVCVDDAATKLLGERLKGSQFANEENLGLIIRTFEAKVSKISRVDPRI